MGAFFIALAALAVVVILVLIMRTFIKRFEK
jgi:hypothetical protein